MLSISTATEKEGGIIQGYSKAYGVSCLWFVISHCQVLPSYRGSDGFFGPLSPLITWREQHFHRYIHRKEGSTRGINTQHMPNTSTWVLSTGMFPTHTSGSLRLLLMVNTITFAIYLNNSYIPFPTTKLFSIALKETFKQGTTFVKGYWICSQSLLANTRTK